MDTTVPMNDRREIAVRSLSAIRARKADEDQDGIPNAVSLSLLADDLGISPADIRAVDTRPDDDALTLLMHLFRD